MTSLHPISPEHSMRYEVEGYKEEEMVMAREGREAAERLALA
jgi:hypothetical protein